MSAASREPERVKLASLGPEDAESLEDRICAARLVCFPTDTVYGVGGALTPAVAAALVRAKGRDPAKPLQVVFGSVAALEEVVAAAPGLRAAWRRLLPGPLTLVVPSPPGWAFPPPAAPVAAGEGAVVATIGVRVPAWPRAARCLAALRHPLAASSANPSGAPAPAAVEEVDPRLLAHCDLVLDAGPVAGRASSVVDLIDYARTGRWTMLRVGAWGEAEIADRLGEGGGKR